MSTERGILMLNSMRWFGDDYEKCRGMIKLNEGGPLLKRKEDRRGSVIGWGRNSTSGKPCPETCTVEEAEEFLTEDIEDSVKEVVNILEKIIGKRCLPLHFDSIVRFAGLVDMHYTLGSGQLLDLLEFRRADEVIREAIEITSQSSFLVEDQGTIYEYWGEASWRIAQSAWATQLGIRNVRTVLMIASGIWRVDAL